jgi:hypothetical protein
MSGQTECSSTLSLARVSRLQSTEGFEKGLAMKKKQEELHYGAVCSHCGKTVTNREYSKGESDCCGKWVVSEEEYQ